MNIFDALKKDHETVRELLAELLMLADDDTEGRRELVDEIRNELVPHARAEESVFYNSLRALDKGSEVVMHGFREHMEAEALLRALQVEDKLHAPWRATAEKLREAVEHHIREEESKIFTAAAGVFTREEADELGRLFESMKEQVEDEGLLTTTFEMMLNTLPPRLTAALRSSPEGKSNSQAS